MPSSTLLMIPHILQPKDEKKPMMFDSSLSKTQSNIPTEFIWPKTNLFDQQQSIGELNEPLVDVSGFISHDAEATGRAAELVRAACLSHGFFQVTNHGVDTDLIRAAHEEIQSVFKLPGETKLGLRHKQGEISGYSGAHSGRYSSELPWKETFSFGFGFVHGKEENMVADFFRSGLGDQFEQTGWVYQKYCEAMKEVALLIFELLAISLGIDRLHFRKFFEDGNSIMRCNYYPTCENAGLTFGTGPHSDPTALTILHQDQVGGLQVFVNGKWQAVRPRPDALVINLGDTFMALCNGMYKSCLHRAVVNRERERISLVFFVCPKEDKVVRPPQDLHHHHHHQGDHHGVRHHHDHGHGCFRPHKRNYPDFTWSELFHFTQNHYRADASTLHSFFHWLDLSSKP